MKNLDSRCVVRRTEYFCAAQQDRIPMVGLVRRVIQEKC